MTLKLLTQEECNAVSSKIIDLLRDADVYSKWRVISALYNSLRDTCESEGYYFMEIEEKCRGGL